MRFLETIFIVILAAGVWSCDAPRDNPYDPASSNYQGAGSSLGSVHGRVTQLNGTTPVPQALVYTIPGNQGILSNDQGFYALENVPTGAYQLVCVKDGFANDTAGVTVVIQEQAQVDFSLDAIPAIADFVVTSHYIFEPPFSLYYTAIASAWITELDGADDIARIEWTIAGVLDTTLEQIDDSTIGTSTFYYSIELNETALPGDTIGSIMGRTMTCLVQDTAGYSTSASQDSLWRYFEQIIYYIGPEGTINDPTPELRWSSYNEPFFYRFNVFVYRSAGSNPLIWSQLNMPASATLAVVEDTLVSEPPNNSYFWIIEAIDEYGNSARTGPINFTVYQR